MLIVVAAAFGHVLVAVPPLGAALLALAVAGAVWARRFGPRGRRIGRLAAAPFVSVLIVPVPALAAGTGAALLVPLVAIAGQALTAVALTVARVRPEAEVPPRASRARSGLAPSTKQAIQILVALLLAFTVGFVVFGRHWAWVVVTVYVVQFGARGRGDAVLKATERLGGAVGGTAAGMAVAFVPLPTAVRVALILVVLTAALALRSRSYVWWAAGMTTALALLYDVLGIGSPTDLVPRIGAVLVGGVLAVASSWLVLPIRSRDVLRGRVAQHLAAVQEALHAAREGEEPSLGAVRAAAARVEELAPAHRAHARFSRATRRPEPPAVAVVAIVERIDDELAGLLVGPPPTGVGALERQVGALRRLNGRREDAERVPVPERDALRPLGEALDSLWDPLSRLR